MMTDTSPFDIPPLKTKEELLDFCLLQTDALENINEWIYDSLSFSYKDGFLNPKLTEYDRKALQFCDNTIVQRRNQQLEILEAERERLLLEKSKLGHAASAAERKSS